MQITIAAKRQASLEALRAWHNTAIKYPDNYQLTFTQLIDWIDKSGDGKGSWRENFGGAVIDTQEYLGFNAVSNAMTDLAEKSEGRVTTFPDGFFRGSEFFEALIGKVSTWNWDKIKVISTDVAKSVADKVDFGSKLFLGGTLTYVIVAGLIGVVIFANAAGKSVKVK